MVEILPGFLGNEKGLRKHSFTYRKGDPMRKRIIMWIGLFATGLIAMSGTEAMAVLNIGGGSISTTCRCTTAIGSSCLRATHPTCTASIPPDRGW